MRCEEYSVWKAHCVLAQQQGEPLVGPLALAASLSFFGHLAENPMSMARHMIRRCAWLTSGTSPKPRMWHVHLSKLLAEVARLEVSGIPA